MKFTLLFLTACAARPAAPVVYVQDPGGDPSLHAQYIAAAEGWSPLGFDFTFDDPGLPECTHWAAGDNPDCQIVAWLFRVDGLAGDEGTQASFDPSTRAINIDTSLTGWRLDVATAHEFGHLVLQTGEHTQGGIMGGVDDRMWGVDRALACKSIGVCL